MTGGIGFAFTRQRSRGPRAVRRSIPVAPTTEGLVIVLVVRWALLGLEFSIDAVSFCVRSLRISESGYRT